MKWGLTNNVADFRPRQSKKCLLSQKGISCLPFFQYNHSSLNNYEMYVLVDNFDYICMCVCVRACVRP